MKRCDLTSSSGSATDYCTNHSERQGKIRGKNRRVEARDFFGLRKQPPPFLNCAHLRLGRSPQTVVSIWILGIILPAASYFLPGFGVFQASSISRSTYCIPSDELFWRRKGSSILETTGTNLSTSNFTASTTPPLPRTIALNH